MDIVQIPDINKNIIPALNVGICVDIQNNQLEIPHTGILRITAISETRIWQTTELQPDKKGVGMLLPENQVEYVVGIKGTLIIEGNCNIMYYHD